MKFFDKDFLFASFSAYGVFIVSLTCAFILVWTIICWVFFWTYKSV